MTTSPQFLGAELKNEDSMVVTSYHQINMFWILVLMIKKRQLEIEMLHYLDEKARDNALIHFWN